MVAQVVKNQLAVQETWIQSLSWKDPLEKGMATHSSVLAWRIPCTEEPGGLQSMQSQRVGHNCAHTITEKKMLPSVLTHVRRKCSYYHTQIIR